MLVVRVEEVLCCAGNTVNLGKSTDTEQTNHNTENSKKFCQPFPFFAHTFFNIVERSAYDMSVLRYLTVFHCQKTFGVLGCRTD